MCSRQRIVGEAGVVTNSHSSRLIGSKGQTDSSPTRRIATSFASHDFMLPLLTSFTLHDKQTPSRHPHIFHATSLLSLARLPRPHTPVIGEPQFMEPYPVTLTQIQTADRRLEAEVLDVGRDALSVLIFIHDTIFGRACISVKPLANHPGNNKFELVGHRTCCQSGVLDPLSLCRRRCSGRHQTVCTPIMDHSAGKVGTPFLLVKEFQQLLLFFNCDKVGQDAESRNAFMVTGWLRYRGSSELF